MILTLYNDKRQLSGNESSGELGVSDLPHALRTLRMAYSDHRAIASIGSIQVIAAPGAESAVPIVEERLAGFLHDMGNSVLDCWQGAKHALQNLPLIAVDPKHDSITGIYNGPVLCVASGPSAQQWFPFIRIVQDKVCIVAADSILGGLLDAGIEPHFVCMLERDPLLTPLVCRTGARARLVIPAVAFPGAIAGWAGRRVWWWQGFPDLYNWLGDTIPQRGTGRSAGTMAAAVASNLGTGNVYLIGHDLCRASGGESHAASVHLVSSSSHAKASGEMEALHSDVHAENGNVTCQFWKLCREDLATLASENTGRFKIIGEAGLDIDGVDRVGMADIHDFNEFTFPESLAVSPSRLPIDGVSQIIMRDLGSWQKIAPTVEALSKIQSPAAIAEASALVHPRRWADARLAGMYTYVFGPAYRAASMRSYLRAHLPTAHADGFAILLRVIPAMLRRMSKETMPPLRAAALAYDIDMSRCRCAIDDGITEQEFKEFLPEQHSIIFDLNNK